MSTYVCVLEYSYVQIVHVKILHFFENLNITTSNRCQCVEGTQKVCLDEYKLKVF